MSRSTHDQVLTFLAGSDAAYCWRCLAAAVPGVAVQTHLEARRPADAALIIGDGTCAICQLTTTVVAYVPDSPDLARIVRRI